MPLVSIITPAYNAEKTIKDTYESIKAQTFKDWEWIVVDDCSKDKTFQVISDIATKDHRVRIFQNEKNSQTAYTRNHAIRMATGRYIAFLDADDTWKPLKLEHQIKFMKDNDYVFTYTNYDVRHINGKIKSYIPRRNFTNFNILLRQCDIGCLTVIYDAEKLGKVYMPENCFKREDYAAWLSILKTGVIAYKLNEILAVYTVGNSSAVTYNKLELIKFHYRVYRYHLHMSKFKSMLYLLDHSFRRLFKGY